LNGWKDSGSNPLQGHRMNRKKSNNGHLSLAEWRLLLRPRLLLMVCASTLTGAVLAPGRVSTWTVLQAVLAVGLLTAAATLLNQVQERGLDARMERTRDRPLATGRLPVPAALRLCAGLLLPGLLLLAGDPVALGLGLLAVAWYNLVYTPLKRLTSLAVLPGALCGALPPLIGWVSAGGGLLDRRVLLLSGLLAVWQVPHFMLLALRYRDDYARAGLPVFAAGLSEGGVLRVISAWTLAAAFAALAMAVCGGTSGLSGRLLLPALGSWLIYGFWRQARRGSLAPFFMRLNLFMLLVLAALLADHLV